MKSQAGIGPRALSLTPLVYGQPLRVPGDFLPYASAPWSATAQRAFLQDAAKAFAPIPTAQHGTQVSRVPMGLHSAEHMFIRYDAHRDPKQPPYDGPFRVLEHGGKHLVVDLGGKAEHVSVDRVKAAHLDLDQPVVLARPPRRGRPPALTPVTELGPAVSGPTSPGGRPCRGRLPGSRSPESWWSACRSSPPHRLCVWMNNHDVSDSPPVSTPTLSVHLEKFHGGGGKTNAPRTNTQPVGLSLGEHTMTKKGPAVIASPCLMWSDDGSPLARR
ncbi:uncharacterized protein [Notothenia coriiceps]|uniref:Uncharacterized protein n=1 Tax=Notothenia coriiceps TaxID=8208 RepID=A0A6I9NRB1_9TELE|nr:PREDICTED: uncharacterized protein LOC104952225 [Notothenia coriiceps]